VHLYSGKLDSIGTASFHLVLVPIIFIVYRDKHQISGPVQILRNGSVSYCYPQTVGHLVM
jgi:hypothetical protein